MEPTLSATTPEELAAMIRGKSDAEIAAMVDMLGPDAVLDKVFSSMASRFLPERARNERAIVQWDVETSVGMRSHQLHIEAGRCTFHPGAPASGTRVALTLSVPTFLRLVSGTLNGLQAFSRGQVRVRGEEVLALAQQLWFDVDMSEAKLEISTPSELRRLIEGRADAEIEMGLALTGIDKALDQVFQGMVDHYLPRKAPRKRTVVEFSIRTQEGDRVYQFVADGERGSSYHRGSRESANVTLMMRCPTFMRMVAGELDGVAALVQGKIKLRGNPLTARGVQSWFDLRR